MTATSIALAATVAIIKKVIDDVYDFARSSALNRIPLARSSVKDRSIASALHRNTKVKTLWNTEKEVSLYDFYFPAKISFGDEIKKRVDSLRDLGPVKNLIIQGTAGQGKSIFLRFLCGQELIEKHSTGRIPLFVELRRIRTNLSLESLILEALEKFKLPASPEAWDLFAKSGKFVLLLDAFDEVEPSCVQETISELERLSYIFHESLQIIVTSRPDSDIQNSTSFRVCKLCPLTKEDQLPLLKKLCSEKSQAEELHKVLKESPAEVSTLLTTPLMVTLLVILYKSLQTIPDTVPKFYEELFDVLFYRHDHSKPGFRRKRHTELDDSTIKKLFSAFCFYTRLKSYSVLSNEQLIECCELASKVSNAQINPQKFKLEISKTVCLIQEEGFEISFIHKSVAQYYAASFVSKSSDKFSEEFYKIARKAFENWSLELRFLCDIDSYRFSKYFYMPSLQEFFIEAGINDKGPRGEFLKALEDYLVGNTEMFFYPTEAQKDPLKSYKGAIFGGMGFNGFKNKISRDLYMGLIVGLIEWMDSDLDFNPANLRSKSAVNIPLSKIVKDLPEGKICEIIEASYSQIEKKRDQAMACLAAEEEKINVFSELLPR